jgi:multidrug efflux pump
MQRATVQADQEQRMETEDLLNLNVQNADGGMVPLSAFASVN